MALHRGVVSILSPTPGLGAVTRILSYDEADADEKEFRNLGTKAVLVGPSSGLSARVDAIIEELYLRGVE